MVHSVWRWRMCGRLSWYKYIEIIRKSHLVVKKALRGEACEGRVLIAKINDYACILTSIWLGLKVSLLVMVINREHASIKQVLKHWIKQNFHSIYFSWCDQSPYVFFTTYRFFAVNRKKSLHSGKIRGCTNVTKNLHFRLLMHPNKTKRVIASFSVSTDAYVNSRFWQRTWIGWEKEEEAPHAAASYLSKQKYRQEGGGLWSSWKAAHPLRPIARATSRKRDSLDLRLRPQGSVGQTQ